MNQIKRFAGIIWMLLGPVCIYVLLSTALDEIEKKPVIDTTIQWSVFIGISIPIAIGMVIFGYYALKGEYDHLPSSSKEITD